VADVRTKPEEDLSVGGGVYPRPQRTAAAVIQNSSDGVAVVSAIAAADNPMKAAGDLKQIIDEARKP